MSGIKLAFAIIIAFCVADTVARTMSAEAAWLGACMLCAAFVVGKD